jgi:hypothetical protein
MMANKEMKNLLDDIMTEKIASSSVSELMAEYNITADEIQTTQSQFLGCIKKQKLQLKKKRLKDARAKLEVEKKKHGAVDVAAFLAKKGKDAKAILIDLLVQQKLPENLTVAHREGKEFTDEDANQIIANLIAMGEIDLDDKGD